MEKATVIFNNGDVEGKSITIDLNFNRETSQLDYKVDLAGYTTEEQLDFTGFLADTFLRSLTLSAEDVATEAAPTTVQE